MTTHIAMWSGPRNLSTALMRSFSSRADTTVSDEPFYGAYLKATGDDQPMLRELLELCARMCEQCAAECEKHDMEHCKLCAQMCRECAEDCRKAAESIG